VLWKELTQVANRRRFKFQIFLGAAGMLFLFVVMGIEIIYSARATQFYTWQYMATFGFGLFAVGSGLLSAFACFGALVCAAAIVSEEHAKQRLGLLLATPLDSLTILGAKLASVIGRSAAVAIAALPVFAVIPFFGGVELRQVAFVAAFLAANLWFYGSLGLFLSVVLRKTRAAISLAVLFAILYNVAYMVLGFRWGMKAFAPPRLYITALSPYVAFVALVKGALPVGAGFLQTLHITETAGLGVLLFAAAVLLFRPLALRRLSGAHVKPRKSRRERKRGKGRTKLPGRTETVLGYGEGIIGKELCGWKHWKVVYSLVWFVLLYLGILVGSFMLEEWDHWFELETHYIYFCIEVAGFFLLLSLRAAGKIAGEREKRTLRALVITRLGRARIILGKAAALVIRNWLAFLWLAAHLLLVRFMAHARAEAVFGMLRNLSFTGLVVGAVFSIALGLYFSVAAKNERTAALATVVTWFLGTGLALWIAAAVADAREPEINVVLYTGASVLAAVLVFLALVWGRRRGHGAGLAFATYIALALVVLLVSVLFVLNPFTREGAPELDNLFTRHEIIITAVSLPVATYTGVEPMQLGPASKLRHLLKLALPTALFLWMTVSVFWSFEAQAKKE
jgi:hypothetical protein